MNYFDKDFDLSDALQKADAGDRKAIHAVLAYLAAEGDGEPDLEDRERKYVLLLAEENDPVGLIMLGTDYQKGRLFPKDAQKALELFQKAVELGCQFGNECIGEMYYFGDGVSQDYQKAYEYLTKSEGSKSPVTYFLLGEMFREGHYVEKNEELAVEQYYNVVTAKYAEMDSYFSPAAYRLAEHYSSGENPDYEMAWKCISAAKEYASDTNMVAAKFGITPLAVNNLWLRLFQLNEAKEDA